MITPDGHYRSNLVAPDLRPHFKNLNWRRMGHSFEHMVASDWSDYPDSEDANEPGFYKKCGLWTMDEAALLHTIMAALPMQSEVIDIGAHTGWTSKHVNYATNAKVYCVDPMLSVGAFRVRFQENTGFPGNWIYGRTSEQFFHDVMGYVKVGGVVIDGDHEPGSPLRDAQNAVGVLSKEGVIVFHDGTGEPTREAVAWLMDHGYRARMYLTPHVVFACWKDGPTPPDHVPDPFIVKQDLPARMPEFRAYLERIEATW